MKLTNNSICGFPAHTLLLSRHTVRGRHRFCRIFSAPLVRTAPRGQRGGSQEAQEISADDDQEC